MRGDALVRAAAAGHDLYAAHRHVESLLGVVRQAINIKSKTVEVHRQIVVPGNVQNRLVPEVVCDFEEPLDDLNRGKGFCRIPEASHLHSFLSSLRVSTTFSLIHSAITMPPPREKLFFLIRG